MVGGARAGSQEGPGKTWEEPREELEQVGTRRAHRGAGRGGAAGPREELGHGEPGSEGPGRGQGGARAELQARPPFPKI